MARPTNSGEADMATEDFNMMNFPPSLPFLPTLSSVPPPSQPLYFPTSSNSMVVYPSPRSPSSSNSMVLYYQGSGSGQSSMNNPLQNQQQQRPTNSGDQSDMATEEHFDVTSFLNLPQWSPLPSPCSSAYSMFVYQQGSSQSSMDFVDRPLYIAGDMALSRQKLLQFWMDASDELGPRGGIMSINNKENLPRSLECLGISLLHLYVEDKFDTLLYWPGESSWEQLSLYLLYAIIKLLQGGELAWAFACDDLERNDYGRGVFGNERVTMGVWRIGPREWMAKIRYQRLSLESPFYVDEQVVLEDARLDFPGHLQDFLHTVAVVAALRKDPDEDDIDLLRKSPVIDGWRLNYLLIVPWQFGPTANQDEDFVNGEVEGTEEAEIAESQLNLGPSRKRQRKKKTPTGERGNKKNTRVKNVIPLDKILQVKEMHLKLKDPAEFLKVSRSALKLACQEHGINRWPPCNKHEQSLPNKTPAVVDQEGIPQLTSDTLPSDQALTATVDTNSVAEETASQQFLVAVRQENPYENSGNAEVEPVGMGGVGTRESEKLRNENAPGRERGKYKTTGVRIELALEVILRYKKKPLNDAARELKVSKSTLKRICWSYKIPKWPAREEHKLESPIVVGEEEIPPLNSDTLLPPNQISATSDTNCMTVKAKYKGFRIKFQLSWPWRKVELEQEVKKRLQLDAATYYITYKDEDDEMTLIGCDEDLEGFISSISPLDTRSIELFL